MNRTRRNTTPINWLHQKRVETAKRLVNTPTVKEVTKEELLAQQVVLKKELMQAINLLHELQTRLDVLKQTV